ncbi:Zinc finger RING/FYVE/PHD-type protein [Dioscorea alata]|uniref:Zinc finger RING/FYVE/PHD-type protein n=1 Tax=Dioscorea alata TaxID=55571 RepID=A0ACB7TWQ2_DIOAL|nr:Zinc finger RING/FYVE/PHD-type protein [Dioscorea alata]
MINPHPPRNIAPLSSIKRPSPSSISLPPKSPPNPTRISIPITCMTSASELFQSLRSRNGGRNPLSNPIPAPIHSDFRHRRHHRRHGLDLNSHEDRNPLRRPRSIPRNDSPAEHQFIWPDHASTSEYRISDGRNASAPSSRVSRFSLNANDRLPGTVLLAQARLAERLRGASLTRSRFGPGVPSILWDEIEADDDLSIIGTEIWEPWNASEWSAPGRHLASVASEANQEYIPQSPRKKPPGLTSEAICSLNHETFKEAERDESMEFLECSICLDKFQEGDVLFRLYCKHRFHCICLEPWLRSCGDCPNCRNTVKTSASSAKRQ